MGLEWGIEVVLWLQRFSPALDTPFLVLTFLGDEKFLLPVVLGLYWCVDRRTGLQLGLVLLYSSYVNNAAKELAQQPRPHQYDVRVLPIDPGGGGGLPSGHTQATTVFWGYVATQWRQSWVWGVSLGLLLGVPVTRVYLGAHFPLDLLAGYLLGAGVLLLFFGLAPLVEAWLGRGAWKRAWAVATGLPLLLLLFASEGGRHNTAIAAGLLGIGGGIVAERQWIGFDTRGPLWQRAGRLGTGLLGLVLVVGLLRLTFESVGETLLVQLLGFGLAGFWVGGGAPWVFVTLRLAGSQRQSAGAAAPRDAAIRRG